MRTARRHSQRPRDTEETEALERRRARVHAARRRWRLRLLVKCLMWLTGAYTVRLWDKEHFKIYLIVSVLLYIYVSIVQEGDHDDNAEETVRTSSLPPAREDVPVRGPEPALREARMPHPRPAGDQTPRRERRRGEARDGVAGTTKPAQAPTSPEPEVVNAQQQLRLLNAMRALGTRNAMRCVTDTPFRQRVLEANLAPYDDCLCGSQSAYGRCCLPLHEELKALF